MPAISVLMKPSSSMCNMSCDYCFYCDEAQKRTQESFGYMSEQTLKNIIRKTMLRAEGMISYTYQGGEPTLRGVGFFKKASVQQESCTGTECASDQWLCNYRRMVPVFQRQSFPDWPVGGRNGRNP